MHTLSHNMKNQIIGLKYKREIQEVGDNVTLIGGF